MKLSFSKSFNYHKLIRDLPDTFLRYHVREIVLFVFVFTFEDPTRIPNFNHPDNRSLK